MERAQPGRWPSAGGCRASEIEAIGLDQMRTRMEGLRGGAALDGLADRVLAGELDPYAAAEELLSRA